MDTPEAICARGHACRQGRQDIRVGGASDKVVVTADTELLDTGSANLGTTLGTKEVADLPNVGRHPRHQTGNTPGQFRGR
jgi:hypothetical protein